MVAVFNKELLSWYLITLKLRETVQQNVANGLEEESAEEEQPETEISEPDPEWVITIREKLQQSLEEDCSASWGKLCIYRIPKCLRDSDDNKTYVPQIVSLGPYHHDRKKTFRDMEHHKWRALRRILERTKQDVRQYFHAMKDLEKRARECYEGIISIGSDEFCEMMILDGCFILELFRGAVEGFTNLGYSRFDPVFAMRGSMYSIQRDMIMMENQLPLFVLERLYALQEGDPNKGSIVAKLVLQFFDPLMPNDEPLVSNRIQAADVFDPLTEGGLHCLDVFRRSLLRSGPSEPVKVPKVWRRRRSRTVHAADKRRQQLVHCITELREAGIKIRKRRTDRFWDIRFENGFLRMPRLLIHDGTKSLFLNLIAFEQCHLDCSNDITSYVVFLDNLINSSDDVSYLHYRGIMEHWLGSDDEVADLFNKLCEEVVFDINESYLSTLSEQMNDYYNHRWNTWRATLKHNYFSNPWAILSLLAAVVLLLLTFAQTFYTVYAYYKPPN
ncbi:UPF0481 protein [Nymphaea thermarum]|nr:UPF0481 protein [Nymphaea thermarum]